MAVIRVSNLMRGLLALVVLSLVALPAFAGTGASEIVSKTGRQAPDPLGYPYFQYKYVRAGTTAGSFQWANGADISNNAAACALWDTLRIGRDLNGDSVVDSTFVSGEGVATSRDYVKIRRVQVIWFGSATDTLWIKMLNGINSPDDRGSSVLSKFIIRDPTYDILEFPVQCDRVVVSGGRTNVAGAWAVIVYAGP